MIQLTRSYFEHCWGGAFYLYSLAILFGLIWLVLNATIRDIQNGWLLAGIGSLVLSVIPAIIGSVIGGRIADKLGIK